MFETSVLVTVGHLLEIDVFSFSIAKVKQVRGGTMLTPRFSTAVIQTAPTNGRLSFSITIGHAM